MKPRFIFWIVSLVAVVGLSSCAPAVTSAPTLPAEALAPNTAATVELPALIVPETTIVPPSQAVEIQAVATSRGPNLEATDPSTVNLASGQLQLVEFFRFT